MTIVFVHGVPETTAVWQPLLSRLRYDDVVLLSPPGFGAPVPAGFESTSDSYRDWLVGELEALGASADHPVDLVGHDWGGGHVMRAATVRPELVRKLVTDVAGIGDPEYVWHDLARIWQTEGAGEQFVAATATASVDDRARTLVGAGMTPDAARACAAANDETMGRCVLALYRSAKQPRMTHWSEEFRTTSGRPETMAVIAHRDAYCGGPEMARRVAQRWAASTAEFEDLGHWWMLQDPVRSAEALERFLA